MDEQFLTRFRKEPSPQFAKSLYERIDKPMNTNPVRNLLWRWRPALVGVSAAVLLLLLFSFPATQALAQEFLNLFRVKRFSVITLDPARIEQLRNKQLSLEGLISDKVQVIKDPGEPQTVVSVAAAAQVTGLTVRAPSWLPDGAKLIETRVQGAGSVRLTADVTKLQAALDALDIKDVKAPAALNGAQITLNKPPMVMMRYSGRDPITFFQAKSPEVELPKDVKVSDLALIGLRIVGLSSQEAQQFAKTIDWNTTMLVPIPANAASFREVSVRGVKGLLITTGGTGASSARFGPTDSPRQQSLLLWAENDMVYAMQGGPIGDDIVQMANSLK